MRSLFLETIAFLESAFARIEAEVPAPKWTVIHGNRHARYEEKTPQQALVQKLARAVSGLGTLDVLLADGRAQEQGIIKRVLDEIHEDILFLYFALINDEWTPRHDDYINDFWAEEFDHPDPVEATQKRATVPRKKIRATNAKSLSENAHGAAEIERTIYNAYSGYVHANSSVVMEMCSGDPPRFTFKVAASDAFTMTLVEDAWNYMYRGLIALGLVAKALGNEDVGVEVYRFMYRFEDASGREYSNDFREG